MIEGKCWNCGKLNKIKEDGYCWCNCKDVEGNKGLWYSPMEKKEKPDQEMLFLDDEEKNG